MIRGNRYVRFDGRAWKPGMAAGAAALPEGKCEVTPNSFSHGAWLILHTIASSIVCKFAGVDVR